MTHGLVTSIFIGNFLLGYAVQAASDKIENRVYKPIAAQDATLEIDHALPRVDFTKEEKYSAEVMEAQRDGAIGAITLKIVDQAGNVVSNAAVTGGFYNHGKKGYGFDKTAGPDGRVELKNRCVGDLRFSIEKDGYYKTSLVYWFFKARYNCVKDKRWAPWNPTIEVVLKRKINPVAMYVATYGIESHSIPFVGKEVGFDLWENDWVQPDGRGKHADFFVVFEWDGSKYANYKGSALTLLFKEPYSGTYRTKTDSFSTLKSPYQADTNAVFDESIKFSYIRGNNASETFDKQLKGGECLILRIRTRVDNDDRLISAHYAKIYGPMNFGYALEFPGSVGIRYYLNPIENDPNLEADTTVNLLNPRKLFAEP